MTRQARQRNNSKVREGEGHTSQRTKHARPCPHSDNRRTPAATVQESAQRALPATVIFCGGVLT